MKGVIILDISVMINNYLKKYNVEVIFSDFVLNDDLQQFDRGQLEDIVAAIIKRFENNGNPHVISGNWRLKQGLRNYLKIRLLSQMIRIVYKVEERNELTVATIIAIGPKHNDLVYDLAKKRLK